MRNEYQKLTEAEAIALLERVIERAERVNEQTRVFLTAFALRAETFVAILKANPDIVGWQQQRDLQYRPTFRGWIVHHHAMVDGEPGVSRRARAMNRRMFRIMHVSPTDYEASPDREKLQQLADELNRDARSANDTTSRWIVVDEATVGRPVSLRGPHT